MRSYWPLSKSPLAWISTEYNFIPTLIFCIIYFQVAWIHIDRQMILTIHRHVISRVPRFSVSHDNAKTWLLHVSSVQKEDRGYYMCQVNTNPMISQVGYLQVVGEFPSGLFNNLSSCTQTHTRALAHTASITTGLVIGISA